MSKPFTPHKPKEFVVVKIMKEEADLIQKLRRYSFGQFTVHKMSGNLVRVEIVDSQLINSEGEISLD